MGKKQRAAPTDMKTNDRVEKIINDLFEFGVSIEVLFDVDDLVKAKNIPKVSHKSTMPGLITHTLYELILYLYLNILE